MFDLLAATNAHRTRAKFKTDRQMHLYPSEASVEVVGVDGKRKIEGKCMRAAYYRAVNTPGAAPPNARTERIFSTGNVIEDDFVSIWKEMGLYIDSSVKFWWAEYCISGEIDCILSDPETGKPFAVEVKSFYGYEAHRDIFGNKHRKGFPKMQNLLQTVLYLFYFRDRLPYAKLVYRDRGDCEEKEFNITVEQDKESTLWYCCVDGERCTLFTINNLLERYKLLNDHVQNKILPMRDFELVWSDARVEAEKKAGNVSKTAYAEWQKKKRKIGDWACSYCPYKAICWEKEEDAGNDLLALEEIGAHEDA